MGFLSRLSSIEYQLLKTLTPAPGDDVIVGIVQSVLRAIVGAASLATEPVSSSILPVSFLGATVSWGASNATFTVTKSTWQVVDQPINGALVGLTTALTAINIAAIEGVTVPAIDGLPVTAITETAQYTGTVTWDPDDNPFGQVTEYEATITLTAKAGYTLTGVSENFFTVAGADTDTNPEDSGVVTAVFPSTGGGKG